MNIMKTRFTLLLATFISLLAAQSRGADTATFENKDLGIRFTYPASLTPASPPPAGTDAMFLSKPDKPGDFQENIQLKIINDPKASTAGYLKMVGDGMSKAVQARGAKLEEAADTTVAKTPAVKITYTTRLGATDIKLQTVCVAKGEKIICLIASASTDKFDAFLPSFKQTIDSFEFLIDKPATEVKAIETKPMDTKPIDNKPVTDTKPVTEAKPKTAAEVKPVETKPIAAGAAFESTELGIKLTPPGGWTSRKIADPTILLMLFPDSRAGGAGRLITVTAEPVAEGPPPTLKDLLDLSLVGFKSSAAPAAKITESKDLKLGPERARQAIMSGKNAKGDTEMRAIFLVTIHEKKVFTFKAQGPAADFEAVKESFDAMTATVEFGVPSLKKD